MRRKQHINSFKRRISLLGDQMDANFEDLNSQLADLPKFFGPGLA
jgi:hypothetical protein